MTISQRHMAILGALMALGACSSSPSGPTGSTQAPCPRIAILADGADMTVFRTAGQRDLTAMVLDARITGFDATCDYTGRDRTALSVRITPRFEAERGPAAESRAAELPWFVALSDVGDTTLLDRQAFTTRLTFPTNVPRLVGPGATARVNVPLGEGVRAVDYAIRISFQLTPEQLAHNRARGPR